jgi:hypothetical protein
MRTVDVRAIIAAALVGLSFTGNASASGGRWTVQRTPRLEEDSSLTAVACMSAASCIATGSRGQVSRLPFGDRWDGRAWMLGPEPTPAGESMRLADISCSSTTCVAVGSYGAYPPHPGAEIWRGGQWVNSVLPTMEGSLERVSCLRQGVCIAIGERSSPPSAPVTTAFSVIWNGEAWVGSSLTSVNDPPSPSGRAWAMSCSTATSCTALGTAAVEQTGHYVAPAFSVNVAEQWNGREWTPIPSPRVNGLSARISGISCLPSHVCTAVGAYFAGGKERPLVERWSGRRWRRQRLVSSEASALRDVSCASRTACTAIGFAGSEGRRMLAVRAEGPRWEVVPTPREDGTIRSELADIACPTTLTCFAVGSRLRRSGSSPVILRWGQLLGLHHRRLAR